MKSWAPSALLVLALGACQPSSVEFSDPPTESTLGELAYAVALSNAGHSDSCREELQASLRADRELVVSGVDGIFSESVIDDLPLLMATSVLPALDGGQLDRLLEAVGNSLATLVDDELDPERKGLAAIADLLDSPRLLQDQHLVELGRVIVLEPGFADAVHAVASLSTVSDPARDDTTLLTSLLEAFSESLESEEHASACTGLDGSRAAKRLLDTTRYGAATVAGGPAWVAEVDVEGNPLPAIGASPSDASPFGFGTNYDDARRRVADDGSLVYRYYDAKQTALAHLLRLAGEAAEAGVVFDALEVLDAALGDQVPCAASSEADCFAYVARGEGLHRLLFTLLEIAKYDKPVTLLQTWRDLVIENPELAEDVLVAAGRIIKTLEEADIEVESADVAELAHELLPVLADVFEIRGAGGVPMPRMLMGLVSDLGDSARDFPDELAIAIEHTTLIKANECSADEPSPLSPKVDFSRRRFFFQNGVAVDNRSSLERSIELLHAADCGSVPFTGGKTVAHVIIDLMSRLGPDTVCNLIDDLLGLLGVTGNIGEAVVDAALFTVGCRGSGDVDAADLFVLDDLAKSGALDFYLPVAKSFREEGQLPALLAVFSVLAEDLLADEDASANTASALRPMLPVLIEVLRSGAVDPFFDLNDLLVSIPAIDGQGTMADILVDSLARLLEDRFTIRTASGNVRTSLASEVLLAIEEIAAQVEDRNATDSLERVTDHVTSYLTRTEMDGDRLRLRDSSLVPLLASTFDFLSEAADLPSDQYECYVEEYQSELEDWLEAPSLATALRVVLVARGEGLTEPIEDFIVGLLRPIRGDVAVAPFREILRASASVLQSPTELGETRDLANAVSAMLDPELVGTDLFTALDALLAADEREVLARLVSDALGPSGSPAEDSPAYRLFDAAEHYAMIDRDNACMLSELSAPGPEELEEGVAAALDLLRDRDSVLNTILDMLRKRRGS